MTKPQPPYYKRLTTLTGPVWGTSPDGSRHTNWVLCGLYAWDLAHSWQHTTRRFVVCPPDTDPSLFDWRGLSQYPPALLLPCGPVAHDAVKSLVVALLRDGADRVLVLGDRSLVRYAVAKEDQHVA